MDVYKDEEPGVQEQPRQVYRSPLQSGNKAPEVSGQGHIHSKRGLLAMSTCLLLELVVVGLDWFYCGMGIMSPSWP